MSKRNNNRDEDEYEGVDKVGQSGNKGKWSDEEDNLLRDGMNELGKEWHDIARRIKGRTGHDCLMRWEYHLRPDLVKGPWSPEVITK